MSRSGEGRFEEIARKARRVQQSVELIRATASAPDVRIEVTADGRITALHLADQALAQAISTTHDLAHRKALARAAEQRRELIQDPAVADLLRRTLIAAPSDAAAASPRSVDAGRPADERPDANPYALPRAVARRYGLR
ncbi:YbaB/EbfC family nucleoid-associated protein [Nocardia sp. NPDC052001]|uniref:YbaB/EbfC family nucleoid-associated protein n=1 Tax=Nocardia sp. NPDC052001 TaxID=3154853 RepID=UPI003435A785